MMHTSKHDIVHDKYNVICQFKKIFNLKNLQY